MQSLNRRQIADIQLDRAIELFLDDCDYVSAITLAGPAESLYAGEAGRRFPKKDHDRIAIRWVTKTYQWIERLLGSEIDQTLAISIVNAQRDAFKHYQDGSDVKADFIYAAWLMIERATENCRLLGGNPHPRYDDVERALPAR